LIPIRTKTALLCSAIPAACFFLMCGIYSFSGSTLAPHLKTVAIPLFEDQTAEFGIDQQLTDAVIGAINEDNTLKTVDAADADALLSGLIASISDRAGQYNEEEKAEDFRVYITVRVSFEDRHNRQTLWEKSFTDWGQYRPGSGDETREAAIEEAVGKLALSILNETVSGW